MFVQEVWGMENQFLTFISHLLHLVAFFAISRISFSISSPVTLFGNYIYYVILDRYDCITLSNFNSTDPVLTLHFILRTFRIYYQ